MIGFGMGLAQGAATVGRIGYESRLDYTAIGSVVNLASRLCAAAKDGQILVDPVVAAEIGEAVLLMPLGALPLKGLDEVTVHAVASNQPTACPGPPDSVSERALASGTGG